MPGAALSRRPLAGLGGALALAAALPAGADPFLIARADTIRSGAIGTLVLPDGRAVPAATIAASIAATGYTGPVLVGIDLGPRGTLYADRGAATRPLAPFLVDPGALLVRRAGATDFTPVPAGTDPTTLLAEPGALGFRATCPLALACPRGERPDGVLSDGFEAP